MYELLLNLEPADEYRKSDKLLCRKATRTGEISKTQNENFHIPVDGDPSPIGDLTPYYPDQYDCPVPCTDYANVHR